MIDETQKPNDWIGRVLHFVFGAFIGAFMGLSMWTRIEVSNDHGWIMIPIGAMIIGLLGAIWGDRLWYSIGKIFKFWWLP